MTRRWAQSTRDPVPALGSLEPMAQIPVTTPRFWWRAPVDRVRPLAPVDPDVQDGEVRWTDRDDQRWDLIASAVVRVGDALAAGEWTIESDQERYGLVDIEGFPGGLTPTEQSIVASWFKRSECVRADPWHVPPANGRHRLWATLPHVGASLVPICSDALGYAVPREVRVLGENWPMAFGGVLANLERLPWFDGDDPLNRRFHDALATAADGEFPDACRR